MYCFINRIRQVKRWGIAGAMEYWKNVKEAKDKNKIGFLSEC